MLQPDLKTFISKSDRFGNYETFIFVVRADDVLAPNVRQIIQRMGDQLNQNIHVERVVSLTNLPIEALGETHERDELLRDPYLGEYLLSADGMQAQILVFVDISEIGLQDRLELAGDLRSLAESSATASVAIGVTGPSVVAIDAMDLSRQDFTRVIWLLPLLLGGVVLIVVERFKHRATIESVTEITFRIALVIGFIQCLALIPGTSRALALQRAQLKLIHSKSLDHPFFWSPFLLISNWL